MFVYLVQGLFLGFTAAASPGSLQAFYLSQTIQSGWRRTLPTALAPLVSDGPIIILTLLILSQTPEWFLRVIRIVGGVYLIYLALSSLSNLRRADHNKPVSSPPIHSSIFKAALTNLLNPNPYIFWGIVSGPILMSAWEEAAVMGASFLIGFYTMLIGGFVLLITIFGAGKRFAPQLISPFLLFAALALATIGVFQLYSGIKG